jgi:hypothetical protein
MECGKAHVKALAVGEKPLHYLAVTPLCDAQKSLESFSLRLWHLALA